jgi:glycosyltransferase involved in cell wall biosynthesis
VTREIAVHGQALSVRRTGGSGTYALELWRRFRAGEASSVLPGVAIQLLNFAAPEPEPAPTRMGSLARRLARQYLPLSARGLLQRGYRHLVQGALGRDDVAMSAWRPSSPPQLLHELSNYNSCPEADSWSRSSQCRLVVTFLDIQDYFYPEYFDERKLLRRRRYYEFYRERADLFFAISEHTKGTMVERLGIPHDRIKVIHFGADDLRSTPPQPDASAWAQGLGRYLVYPAKAWKHKNHGLLIRALAKRRDHVARARIRLFLTGGFDPPDLAALQGLVRAHRVDNLVEILGFQSPRRLQALLAHAEFLIFPSLYEGFGIPLVEAMRAGCPVLSSTAGALPEIAGDAALYFDPTREDSLIDMLDRVLADRIDREELIQRGHAQAKRFSWDATFEQTIEQYRTLL